MEEDMRRGMSALLGVVLVGLLWAPAGHAEPNKAERYIVPLSGDQVVPGPGDPDATGGISYTLQRHSGIMCFFADTSGVSVPLTGVDLHRGVRGENGDLIAVLYGTSPTDPDPSRCVNLDAEVMRDIFKDRSDFYFDIHNEEFPAGAVRAQLG